MVFFRMTSPPYATDMEQMRKNPIGAYGSGYSVPTLQCPICTRWGSADTNRIVLPRDSELLRRLDSRPLAPDEWKIEVHELAVKLGVPEELLTPGAEIGPPKGLIKRTRIHDFLNLGGGLFWVKPHVKDIIEQADFKGIRFVKVHARWSRKVKDPPPEPPDLWELVIQGKAWRVGMNKERITICEICGRGSFPDPGWLEVDVSRWDGSDFFHVDGNPCIDLVTERVKEFIESHRFTNIAFEPVP